MSAIIAAQLGRAPRADSRVSMTCHLGLPVVIEVPPILDDGTPFPTRFWLTCPLAVLRISRLESAGEIQRFEARRQDDPEFDAALRLAHDRYERDREELVPVGASRRPAGGVAGAAGGVKCLHAHYADFAAGNDNPVGEDVAARIQPLNCATPCVVDGTRSAAWREPREAS